MKIDREDPQPFWPLGVKDQTPAQGEGALRNDFHRLFRFPGSIFYPFFLFDPGLANGFTGFQNRFQSPRPYGLKIK